MTTVPIPMSALRETFAAASPSLLQSLDHTLTTTLHVKPLSRTLKHNTALAGFFDNVGEAHACPPALHEQFGESNSSAMHTCGLQASTADSGCVVLTLGNASQQRAWAGDLLARTNCSLIVADCTCNATTCAVPSTTRDRTRLVSTCVGDPVESGDGTGDTRHVQFWREFLVATNNGRAPSLLTISLEVQ